MKRWLKEELKNIFRKYVWSKHKIIVSVLGGFLVLICLFGIREASLVDPLDGVQQVAWNSYTGSWVVPDKDRDRIASKIRASILKKYGASGQTIKYVEDNPKWEYDSDDYRPVKSDIGESKLDKAINELNYVKSRLDLSHENGNKMVLKIDMPNDRARKDGIRLVNHEFGSN